MKPSEILVVLVTAPADAAPDLARQLVERRVCACVNVVPKVRSIYRWEGEVQEESESLLVIKTTAAAFSALETAIAALHSYDVPEILALPAAAASGAYAQWVKSNVEVS